MGLRSIQLIERLLRWFRDLFDRLIPRVSVKLEPLTDPLYVGSYKYVTLRLRNITLDDLHFEIPAGPAAGMVSVAREANFDPLAPVIVLGAGPRPGAYKLEARDAGGNVLADMPFRVTDRWPHRGRGPSQWILGEAQEPTFGAAWGGGPAVPQNAAVLGHVSGPWRVAVVLVDVAGSVAPFAGDATLTSLMRTTYERAVFDVADQYYQEVSGGEMSIPGSAADIVGPISLAGGWEDYFYNFRPANVWAPRDELFQAVITATDSSFDFRNYKTLLVVTSLGSGGGQIAWPFAWGGVFSSDNGPVNLRTISMPPQQTWGSLPIRPIEEVVVHELGHNLGLWDLYFPDHGRIPSRLDPMANAGDYKHLSAMHRLMLGWLDPAHVRALNVGAIGTAVDETVTLSPINRPGPPPAGAKKAVEVRVSDGHNYYFEYRKKDPADFGDNGFSGNGMVIMTDTISYTKLATTLPDPAGSGEAPPVASPIQHMPPDPDGDPYPESFLRVGDDYEELDISDPTAPAFFRAETVSIDSAAGLAQVRFTWDLATPVAGGEARPDPSIREWPSDTHRWQSPDIEVRNARNWDSAANAPRPGAAAWFNVPWEGHENTVVAKVRNLTPVFAENVIVRFYIKDFSISGAPLSLLGTDTQDVPASGSSGGAPTEFSTTWTPPTARVAGADVHYCVVVDIEPWFSPTLSELDPTNNHAQSNYTRMISVSASPHSREATIFTVTNPYDHETLALLRLSQDNPFYRSYLEHKWLMLGPDESRPVRMMSEFVGHGAAYPDKGQPTDEFLQIPNDLQVKAVFLAGPATDPAAPEPARLVIPGGLGLVVTQGQKAEFKEFQVDAGQEQVHVSGRLATADKEAPLQEGNVILILDKERAGDGPSRTYLTAKVADSGFQATLPVKGWTHVQAYYSPPDHGYGEAYSPVAANPLLDRIRP